ncbi:MAG: hypothetical protein AAF493_12965 [Pseudomonadota bacterium]
MHTVFVIAGGLVLLGILVGVAAIRTSGARSAMARAARLFLPVWLICAGVNMSMGVVKAGYPVMQELPFFVVVFGVPALIAVLCYSAWTR